MVDQVITRPARDCRGGPRQNSTRDHIGKASGGRESPEQVRATDSLETCRHVLPLLVNFQPELPIMTKNQSLWAWGSLIVVLVGFVSLVPGQDVKSPPPEKLLPAEALLYIGWDGTAAHKETWEKTAAYDALVKSGLSDIIARLTKFAEQQAGGQAPVQEIVAALRQLGDTGVYLALAAPQAGLAVPQLTVVVPQGAAAIPTINALAGQIGAAGAAEIENEKVGPRNVTRMRIRDMPFVEFGWWAEGKHLVIAAGMGAVDTALNTAAGKSPGLDTNVVWKKYRAKADFEVALTTWIDLAAIRKLAGPIPVAPPIAGQPPTTVADILKTLGLEKIGPAAMRLGFKNKTLWTETTIEAPSPRSGLVAWDAKPLSLADLPPLPAGTDGFYASRFDWSGAGSGLLKIVGELSRQLDGPGAEGPDVALIRAQEQFGIDIQKDLFEPLGDVLTIYGDTRQGVFGTGLGLAISVDDARKLRATLDKLSGRLVELTRNAAHVESVKKLGRTVQYLEIRDIPFISPAWVVDEKWFVFGLFPQTVEAFLKRVDGKLERWTPPADVKAALAELPAKYTSLTLSDPREGLRMAISLTPVLTSTLVMAGRKQGIIGGGVGPGDAPISVADLPPAEVVTQSLFSNISVCTVTEAEIRWTSRTSLPAIPFLGGAGVGNAGATVPVLVALLLPAVQQAREAARRTQSKSNLRQIALALHGYHDANKNFPAGTKGDVKAKPEERLSWMAQLLPYVDELPAYQKLDFTKGWEDPANVDAVKKSVPVFINPALAADPNAKYGQTHYVGIAGVGKDGPMLPVDHKRAGLFGYNRVAGIADVTDGTSNTMGVAEASKDLGPWGAGGPSTIRPLTKKPYINGPDGLGGVYQGGMNVLILDGSVKFISEKIDPTVLEAISTIAGGEVVGPD